MTDLRPDRTVAPDRLRGKLADRLSHLMASGGPARIPRRPAGATPPLTSGQRRLWFFEQLDPGTAAYHIRLVLRLRGDLDEPALRAALDGVVARHEVLRTTFPAVDGSPVQSAADKADVPFDVAEVRSAEDGLDWIRVTAAEPFDLATGPLLRALLVRVTGDEWLFAVTMHHIVSDGWSMRLFVRELTALYGGGSLEPLPVQYGDYAAWQHQWLGSGVTDRQLEYWRSQLAGALAVLELPTDRPRPAVRSYRGAREPVEIPTALTAAVRQLCQDEGVTVFMLLLAAYKLLLSRFSGQTDVVVGAPIAGRAQVGTESLIGFFVNTLVLRTSLAGNPTGRELLARVRNTALGAYAHQDLPFERLVDELQPDRDLSHSPLFQALFVLQNAPGETPQLPGLAVEPVPQDGGTAKFDLSLDLQEIGDRIVGSLEYRTDLFERGTVQNLLASYLTLLASLTETPDTPVLRLPIIEPGRYAELTAAPQAPALPDRCLHEVFEEQVDRAPEAVAVVCGNDRLTYRELDDRANLLAHWLRERGAGPDTLVGLCVERSVTMVVAVLAVLKAGAAYLPMDPAHPADRLTYTVRDAGARLVLTEGHLAGRFTGCTQVTVLEELLPTLPEQSARPAGQATADNLAYVIYTSGSTGRPKGVMIEHRQVHGLFAGARRHMDLRSDDTWLLAHSIAFDVSVWELWGAFLHGGRLMVATAEQVKDPFAMEALVTGERVTRLGLTPTACASLVATLPGLGPLSRSLRSIVFAGEALSATVLAAVTAPDWSPEARVVNMYGTTETTVHASYFEVDPVHALAEVNHAGGPLPGYRFHVVDALGQLVPPGVAGELLIGGSGVARGYLGRPALTAERFVPDSFGGPPGDRLYRTGDLVRQLADGGLEYLGRIDHQVKLRGFRIELGEIEAVLARRAEVRACAVVLREDTPGDRRLVAYLVGEPERISVTALRDELRRELPDYMVPAALVVLSELPRTPNGKIDRAVLPAPETGRDQVDTPLVAPRTEAERTLAAVWAQVLNLPVEQIGVHDNFFDLGGDSLRTARVVALLRNERLALPLRDMFTQQTIAGQALRLVAAEPEERPATAPFALLDPADLAKLRHRGAR
ncbi:non-ribosomal peptide synthetase [Micromonospora coerulea]|uniref:non-ribosomal peptide synthetase n=1 Tax=Micromonospora coerulea TaxID=47856 RepID=UPI001908E749|nr:non-ribosomal peptide synthetase [Micromonospora veneta]